MFEFHPDPLPEDMALLKKQKQMMEFLVKTESLMNRGFTYL